MLTAHFKFYGSLNDFLPAKNKDLWITYSFDYSPAIKDAVEAIGIPHTEINEIFINGNPVTPKHSLFANDTVEVHPFTHVHFSPQKFILDVHLGKLAKLLRLLGFDALYQNDYTDKDIVSIAKEQERIVLTRDIVLLKHKAIKWGYWLRSQISAAQAKEVIQRFALANLMNPFTRCLVCNGVIEKIDKEKIIKQLPPNTIIYFNEFYHCPNCKKIYWKGSHYERMIQMVGAMIK
jgi:uncharacterized protein with PIN domain